MALLRGFIDAPRYDKVLAVLSTRAPAVDGESLRAFWVGEGWLTDAQLTQLTSTETVPAETQPETAPFLGKPGDLARANTTVLAGGTGTAPDVGDRRLLPTSASSQQWLRYTPTRLIGTGGMGDVYEATDARLGRRVALKVPRVGLNEAVARALTREAIVAGSLEHPAIVPVYDAGEEAGVGPFYAMRLLEQPTLAEAIRRLGAGTAEIPRELGLHRLLRYFIQVCQAVHYAHTRGVVHCDLKPANIIVGEFGEVIVLDWGMAFRLDEAMRTRGGTPGYMAPEQAVPQAEVDIRADIFALGAILYEVLALQPAYDDSIVEVVLKVSTGAASYPPCRPPSVHRRDIPRELEQICLKALQLDPARRYQTADELATDVEAFLEGSRERERRAARAAELLAEGQQLSEMYRGYVDSRPLLVEEVARIRASAAPWESHERKRELWDAEDRLAATDVVGVRTLQAAVAAFESALDEQPGLPAARQGLADLYAIEVERARLRRDELNRLYFEELVKQYGPPSESVAPRHEGAVLIGCLGGTGEVLLHEQEENDRRLVAVRPRTLGPTPLDERLAPGSYLLTIGRPGGARRIRCPILVSPGRDTALEVDLDVIDALDEGECYVPAGPALLGGDPRSPFGPELSWVDVPAFIVAERPVTFAEYLEFLTALVATGDPISLAPHLPVNTLGAPSWRWELDHFEPGEAFELDREALLACPAFGVSHRSAQAYAAWRGKQRGRAYRLLSEAEWEKAARGVDGRLYPWGDYFDASFCKMYESRPEEARPEAPGAFPTDVSPYGVRDTAGGIAEWVVAGSESSQEVSRGGAWCDSSADCRLATRRPYHAGGRSNRVGFRLARSLPSR